MNKALAGRLALLVWAATVAAITLSPRDPLSSNVPAVARPLSEVTGVPEPDVIAFLIGLEWPANLLMFVPLGVFLPGAYGLGFWRVAGVALAATVAIELTQGLLLGARDASGWDVLANLLGGLVGFALVRAVPRQDRLDRAQR